MEKINIAELLKDYPKGMKLYSPIFGDVYLDKIRPHLAIVVTTDKDQGNFKEEFLYDGRYGMNGECMLFPSKGKTTWDGFQRPFKDGDIVTCKGGSALIACIYKERRNTASFNHHIALYKGGLGIVTNGEIALPDDDLCFAAEEEKQQLFDIIKSNGYKWNLETKTLEKLTKFKVGDKIKHKGSELYCTLGEYSKGISAYRTNIGLSLTYKDLEQWELAPNKFDITTLKPFDKVLVRNTYNQLWITDLFSYISKSGRFVCVVHNTYQCIPYESNEHLLGTTNDCSDFYKTWK